MTGNQQLLQIFNELTLIGNWMTAESKKGGSLDDAHELFREANLKLTQLHAKYKAIKLTPAERFQTGLVNKSLRKFIEASKAGAAGKYDKAERLFMEAQALAFRYRGVMRP